MQRIFIWNGWAQLAGLLFWMFKTCQLAWLKKGRKSIISGVLSHQFISMNSKILWIAFFLARFSIGSSQIWIIQSGSSLKSSPFFLFYFYIRFHMSIDVTGDNRGRIEGEEPPPVASSDRQLVIKKRTPIEEIIPIDTESSKRIHQRSREKESCDSV